MIKKNWNSALARSQVFAQYWSNKMSNKIQSNWNFLSLEIFNKNSPFELFLQHKSLVEQHKLNLSSCAQHISWFLRHCSSIFLNLTLVYHASKRLHHPLMSQFHPLYVCCLQSFNSCVPCQWFVFDLLLLSFSRYFRYILSSIAKLFWSKPEGEAKRNVFLIFSRLKITSLIKMKALKFLFIFLWCSRMQNRLLNN